MANPRNGPMTGPLDDPRRFTPVERVLVAYLAATLPLFLLLRADDHRVWTTALLHGAGLLGILALRRSGIAGRPAGRALLDLLPLAVFGVLYGEVGTLNRAFHPEAYFDGPIQAVEAALFGGQPSRTWRGIVPWRPVGEALHAAYFSYYAYVPFLMLMLLFRRSRLTYHRALGIIALTFVTGFACFILVPVRGPYHAFVPPDPATVGYLMPRVVHWVVDRGSSVGTAFPSSHVSVAFTVWFLAMRHHRGASIVLGCFVPLMALGTVYGGFHYLIDVAAGLALAGFVLWGGGRLVDRWLGSRSVP